MIPSPIRNANVHVYKGVLITQCPNADLGCGETFHYAQVNGPVVLGIVTARCSTVSGGWVAVRYQQVKAPIEIAAWMERHFDITHKGEECGQQIRAALVASIGWHQPKVH